MQTEVSTPHAVFWMPQRLMVPLFQRRYVWNEAAQWEPLWQDIVRVAERRVARPQEKPEPHFLGAVVVQQLPHSMGKLPVRTIIDGQQRLTTLQLLLDGLHAELLVAGAHLAAARIEPLGRRGTRGTVGTPCLSRTRAGRPSARTCTSTSRCS